MSSKKTKSDQNKILKEKISINIKKYRKVKHLTQEELAEEADISYDFMRRIESSHGKCGFSVYTLYKIAVALDVSIDELMDRKVPSFSSIDI